MDARETLNNASAVLRGVFKKARFDRCGRLLRCEKGVSVIKKNAEISIGDRVFLHKGVKLSAYGNETRSAISIGDRSYIGDRTEIHAGKSVRIGSGVNIACGCMIFDRDYHKMDGNKEKMGEVVIENHVWIGAGCIILKGVTIGEGAVVAAGSVVTRSVPKGALAAGNPAKIVRENVTWEP